MTRLERFLATAERRPATRLGIPDPRACPQLFDYFGVSDMRGLKARPDDDIYPVEMPYHSPSADAIYMALNFAWETAVPDERDAQHLPVNGKPEEIRARMEEPKALFPTVPIISLGHEAIPPDVHPANIEALFNINQS
jgi:hypothetical protein